MALPIARKYDFQAGTFIQSSQVDEEFNQLVTEVNLLPEKNSSLQTNLNSDLLDGFHAVNGGGTNKIPVCDSTTIQTALNADLLDGQHASDIAAAAFDVGTAMLFYQASPPSGWSEITKANDHVLGWKVGQAGGTKVASSWTLSGITVSVANHTLTTSELPAHTHGLNNHNHSMSHTHDITHEHIYDPPAPSGYIVEVGASAGSLAKTASGTDWLSATAIADMDTTTSGASSTSVTGNATGNTTSTGSGVGHNHTATAASDGSWRPPTAYVIIATKD